MNYEVELKFPLAETTALRQELTALGAKWQPEISQRDTYFAHPQRDFAVTDEAFRLRTEGQRHWLTYKGPLVDQDTKTRQETEVALADGPLTSRQVQSMLASLGFREVRRVVKIRCSAAIDWHNWEVEVSLDDVEGLGSFVEIEIIADPDRWEAAKLAALALAARLGLSQPERRSYLQLLIEQESAE